MDTGNIKPALVQHINIVITQSFEIHLQLQQKIISGYKRTSIHISKISVTDETSCKLVPIQVSSLKIIALHAADLVLTLTGILSRHRLRQCCEWKVFIPSDARDPYSCARLHGLSKEFSFNNRTSSMFFKIMQAKSTNYEAGFCVRRKLEP